MVGQPPVLSPVDYDAWQRGYMPPSEHILIDALSFRGARVRFMSSIGPVTTWVVVQTKDDRPLTSESIRALGKQWRAMLELDLEIMESDQTTPPVSSTTPATSPIAEPDSGVSRDNKGE